jgi:hypothetical protein
MLKGQKKNNMDLKKAFLMSYYDEKDGKISFKGRVLKNLKTGDNLYLLNSDTMLVEHKYIIEKIYAYRHEFEFIDEGMTCEIIVLGEKIAFKEDSIFYL